jgi:(2Fe-2S) ferredoxin
LYPGAASRRLAGYDPAMANPQKLPPLEMARSFGVGGLRRHIFICLGPDCCTPEAGQASWDYLKKRLKELNLASATGSVYRTKCDCLRICIDGPIAVVYPEGTWYRGVTAENVERIIQEHLIGGCVVEELCFARDALVGRGG